MRRLNLSWPESWEHYQKQRKSQLAVKKAIDEGRLIRPDTCELCSKKPEPHKIRRSRMGGKSHLRSGIYAHHWRGYEDDAIFDVWWICHRCNMTLSGLEFHNGSITREQARAIVNPL